LLPPLRHLQKKWNESKLEYSEKKLAKTVISLYKPIFYMKMIKMEYFAKNAQKFGTFKYLAKI
jgi:hypothetical protein